MVKLMKSYKKAIILPILTSLLLPACNSTPTHKHNWGEVSYTWAEDFSYCVATRVCLSDDTHIETERADSIYRIIKPAECEVDGSGRYTATFENKDFKTQTHDITIESFDHDYQFDSFVWNGYNAKAKYVCSHDNTHVDYRDATVTSVINDEPTCTVDGLKTYTATYDGHSDTKTQVLPATDHKYEFDSFIWDGYTAKAKYICSIDSSHIVYYDAQVESKNTAEPTCLEAGTKTYTASYDGHTDTKTETLPALGHLWEEVEAKEPTCTEVGWEAYHYCLRCKETTYQAIDPTGHHFVRDEETLFYECDHEGCDEEDGRDYELYLTIDSVHVGDSYYPRRFNYDFINDDCYLDLGMVSFETEDKTVISPETVDNGYEIPYSLVGQKVTAHVYVVIINDYYAKFENDLLSNCYIFVNGNEISIDSKMTSDLYDGYDRTFYHASIELGEIKSPYNGETPRLGGDSDTVMYGLYPQKRVTNADLIGELGNIENPESNGWYLYNGFYYAKVIGDPCDTYVIFDNDEKVVKRETYWFKCEPITWKYYANDDGSYYLISTKALDANCYYYSSASRTIDDETIYPNNYQYSSIRTYINGEFYDKAFGLENKYIQEVEIDNSKSTTSSSSNKYACNNTFDKVTLPSHADYTNSKYGFSTSGVRHKSRYCLTTEYSRAIGANIYLYGDKKFNADYWTRSPDWQYSNNVDLVDYEGAIVRSHAYRYLIAIRPAITIRVN